MQLGKYQLVRKLAAGGMAEVYLAKAAGPMGFEKTLVLKRILPALAEDPDFVAMFLGEAKLAAQLDHPNIVQVFDFGEAEGSYFLAMELIDGPNLRRFVKHGTTRPLPPALCAKVVASAAEGLAYAHEFCDPITGEPMRLVHRDVSPANILVSRQGAVKVVDFGIAKVAGQEHRTQAGVVKGKLAYMPPEQLQLKKLDRRADIYALGVVLYELLTGKRPYAVSSEAGIVNAVLNDPFIPASLRRPDLPAALVHILDRALEKDRERRYPDCRAFQHDLERFVLSTGEPMGAYQIARFAARIAAEGPDGQGVQPVTPSPGQATRQERAGRTPVEDSVPTTPEGPLQGTEATRRERAGPAPVEASAPTTPARPFPAAEVTRSDASTKSTERVVTSAPFDHQGRAETDDGGWTKSLGVASRRLASPGIFLLAVGLGGLLALGIGTLSRARERAAPMPAAGAGEKPAPLVPPVPASEATRGSASEEREPARATAEESEPAAVPPGVHPALPLEPPERPAGEPQQAPRESPPPAPRAVGRGTLEFRIRPYADVFVDGRSLGQTPLSPIRLAEGRHTVKAVNLKLGREVTRTVEIQAGRTALFKINLEDPEGDVSP
ncbi:serine/threonine-protein kinase [Myxococcus sp. RHSTA-1-4]|uniref:serine/threonine-protein kinase n=1 Tax=Myxococcus sp. RHSTA-1-4 TaxID=2874601 RepID=UPI001CBB7186|nr:serine/threonine-protein kinase [Myxococcus sp. RHSTA-1-4]MBZ4417276.1 protein kinase [Myxococcus sp. RHSTA-1-4]